MKIITYNIWNSDINFEKRLDLLCEEIKRTNSDIVCLQEVRNKNVVEQICTKCDFEYSFFAKYTDYEEGLAILSNHRILEQTKNWELSDLDNNCWILRSSIAFEGIIIGITNLHLDYEKAKNREAGIIEALQIITNSKKSDYEILLGDFNSYPESSVYRFLTGQQSLKNISANWIDLALIDAALRNSIPEVTLDFYNNPRWDNENNLEIPGRFDWILLKNPYPKISPKIIRCRCIGTKRIECITPSDHYGVVVEIDFNNELRSEK